MTAVSSVDELDPQKIEDHWNLVKGMIKVFGGKQKTADDLRKSLQSMPEAHLLHYHNEPLMVAALLVFGQMTPDTNRITASHLLEYDRLKRKYKWGC